MNKDTPILEEQVALLHLKMTVFLNEAKKLTNKSAARRARKLSLDITKKLKQYRADSLK